MFYTLIHDDHDDDDDDDDDDDADDDDGDSDPAGKQTNDYVMQEYSSKQIYSKLGLGDYLL